MLPFTFCHWEIYLTKFVKRTFPSSVLKIKRFSWIYFQFIVDYVKQFGETFCKVLAIRPSGWERKKPRPNLKSQISILGVQYSEHSSYNELERFVRFLTPKRVISTVPYNSKNLFKTPEIPEAWLNQKVEPKVRSYQPNIMDFMVKWRQIKVDIFRPKNSFLY